ncbi:MAG: hypothetical protein FJZ56_05485 [Chlamydiae bacterium]|nr:hypothetical protein [Chlamydiota bacterium]
MTNPINYLFGTSNFFQAVARLEREFQQLIQDYNDAIKENRHADAQNIYTQLTTFGKNHIEYKERIPAATHKKLTHFDERLLRIQERSIAKGEPKSAEESIRKRTFSEK